jgi:polyisoprenoid-binding protein YceI
MNRTLAAVLALALAPLARAETTTWNVDPAHSHASFSVRHLGISNVRGEFRKLDATLFTEGDDPTKARVEATIDVDSIDTREAKRDAHLRSPDFFDAQNHPRMTFKSTKVEKAGDKLEVTGDLTIRGNTKPITLDVELSNAIKDPQGAQRRAIHATGKIDRKAYGLAWSKMLEATPVVGDEVTIEIAAEFVQAPASPAAQAKAEDAAAKGQKPVDAKASGEGKAQRKDAAAKK